MPASFVFSKIIHNRQGRRYSFSLHKILNATIFCYNIIYHVKLSQYAKIKGITSRSAWNHFKEGKIPGAHKDETGHIIVPEKKDLDLNEAAIYTRVSSNENKKNLESQAERLKEYAPVRGYQIVHIVKEIGSGVDDSRKQLLKLLDKDDWGTPMLNIKID